MAYTGKNIRQTTAPTVAEKFSHLTSRKDRNWATFLLKPNDFFFINS
jgi:hypothetical protein